MVDVSQIDCHQPGAGSLIILCTCVPHQGDNRGGRGESVNARWIAEVARHEEKGGRIMGEIRRRARRIAVLGVPKERSSLAQWDTTGERRSRPWVGGPAVCKSQTGGVV